MMGRSFLRFSVVFAMAVALAACGRVESYRYKLTLAVKTPQGIKRGSSVAEAKFFDVSIPAKGTMYKLRGQALYLDLGPGARPLVALLTSRIDRKFGWTPEAGPEPRQMAQLYDITPSIDYVDDIPRIARMRGPRKITSGDLPDLVTFADINDPSTVVKVDPNDLRATLGPDITWNEITLESTDEPVSKGIEQKLPWIPYYYCAMLDGSRWHDKRTLANTLSTADFDQSDEAGERR
jgi:hypothetical protein